MEHLFKFVEELKKSNPMDAIRKLMAKGEAHEARLSLLEAQVGQLESEKEEPSKAAGSVKQ